MPKQVIVTEIWSCSLCELDTEVEKITPYEIHAGAKVLAYDICATCAASDPFAHILSKGMSERVAGAKKTAVHSDDGKAQCLYCEKRYTESGMGMHMASAHGVKSKTQISLEKRGKVGKYVCPECGFRSNAPQGLAAHRSVRHGVTGISENAIKHAEAVAANLPKKKAAVVGHPCPDCPDFVAANAQGLGAHRRHIHPGAPKLGHGGGHKSRKAVK